jgi:hypothetical protein
MSEPPQPGFVGFPDGPPEHFEPNPIGQPARFDLAVSLLMRSEPPPAGVRDPDDWDEYETWDEAGFVDEEGTQIPRDSVDCATYLAERVPSFYRPYVFRGERQRYPLPTFWRLEVFDSSTNELLASAEYTQHEPPAPGPFSHLRWVISYLDNEGDDWRRLRSREIASDEWWAKFFTTNQSLDDKVAIEIISDIRYASRRIRHPLCVKRWRGEIVDGRSDVVIAFTELDIRDVNLDPLLPGYLRRPMLQGYCRRGHHNPPAQRFCGECGIPLKAENAKQSLWSTVQGKVRARSRTTDAMLAGAVVRTFEGDTLVLAHPVEPLARRLSEQRNIDVIRAALKDALGVDWQVRFEVDER